MPSAAISQDLLDAVHAMIGRQRIAKPVRLAPVQGGRNNQVYRVEGGREPLFLKVYFTSASDPRDRFAAEQRFYGLLDGDNADFAPRAVHWDAVRRLGLLTFLDGRKLLPDEVDERAVDRALSFVEHVNALRHTTVASRVRDASEACFSIEDHLSLVGRRMTRMAEIRGDTAPSEAAKAFVDQRLLPMWAEVFERACERASQAGLSPDRQLAPAERCLSPSDFGFHNAIRRPDGTIAFFDFEYSGWDDPAKLTCDFLCQQQLPVPLSHWPAFVSRVRGSLEPGAEYETRAALLLPVYQLKWCCIILNHFLADDSARRQFAQPSLSSDDTKFRQLQAAERLVRVVETAHCQ